MKWIARVVFIFTLLLSSGVPSTLCSEEIDEHTALPTIVEPPAEAERGAEDSVIAAAASPPEARATPSSLWKTAGAWGAAGAVAGSVAPGPGNVIGLVCGVAVGVAHHFFFD